MKIAVLSDIHDHTTHLLLALEAAREAGCVRMIYLGDMVHSNTLTTLLREWELPLDIVFGNNEYELEVFDRIVQGAPHATLHGDAGALEADGKRIFFCHLPSYARRAADSGRFDAVFYGHTHCADIQMYGTVLLANPGEVLGRQSAASIGVYNTEEHHFSVFPI